MYDKLIVVITILFLSRLYYCITGKKTNNPYSACANKPYWGVYGYKLSLLLYMNTIIILLLLRKKV